MPTSGSIVQWLPELPGHPGDGGGDEVVVVGVVPVPGPAATTRCRSSSPRCRPGVEGDGTVAVAGLEEIARDPRRGRRAPRGTQRQQPRQDRCLPVQRPSCPAVRPEGVVAWRRWSAEAAKCPADRPSGPISGAFVERNGGRQGVAAARRSSNLPLARHCLAQDRSRSARARRGRGVGQNRRLVIRARLPGGRVIAPAGGRQARADLCTPNPRSAGGSRARGSGLGGEAIN